MKLQRWVKFSGVTLFTAALVLLVGGAAFAGSIITAVGPIGLTVSDMDRSVSFFSEVLDFRKVSEIELYDQQYDRLTGIFGARVRVATMRLGGETLELTEYLTPPGRPIPTDSRSNDRWFQHIAIVVRDMDRAFARLQQFNVKPVSTAPQRIPDWNKGAAGIRAFYFRDPDQHALELIYFPAGKGDPRWQAETESLFLGIDHTAIAVWDTQASLQFYRDLLGMKVTGESLNYGVEQEHLNHVFGARVQITGLRAAGGPGIEFLEYLTPRDGRPYPADAKPNDLFHWQTTLHTEDAAALMQHLMSNKIRFISGALVNVGKIEPGGERRACLIRDPDGHALKLAEP
jgi:catechol 2,3-dioxygenase-like lactoylglutathione lyase family enzyme